MLTVRSLLVLMLVLSAAPVGALMLGGEARVIDGDTLEVAGKRVRLFGIDAPERRQTCEREGLPWDCGAWAKQALSDRVTGQPIVCQQVDVDRYGRSVAICHVGGLDLGADLVRQGAATAYVAYSSRYVADEAVARSAGRGIWAGPMQTPEAHRRAGDVPVGDCAIKGNISANGRIYHQPGQQDYAATRISTAKGEAYFCSAAQAEAAGFRPARR